MPTAIVALCTLKQVKTRLNIDGIESDGLITEQLIPGALRRLSVRLGREFMPRVTATRDFDLTTHMVQLVNSDLVTATTVVLHPENAGESRTLVAGTDYELSIDPLTNTAGLLELSSALSLDSTRMSNFGKARLRITGAWGCWASVENVPQDMNDAAILMVRNGLQAPIDSAVGLDSGSPRDMLPAWTSGWDIPPDVYRKIQPYDRNLGVY